MLPDWIKNLFGNAADTPAVDSVDEALAVLRAARENLVSVKAAGDQKVVDAEAALADLEAQKAAVNDGIAGVRIEQARADRVIAKLDELLA